MAYKKRPKCLGMITLKNKINVLDDFTINKIAAGEVVERPVSVIKELIENSIDAGATRIIVEIQEGGKKLIRITDNGCGIDSGEVEKAFLRHATSKIKSIEDLYKTFSLGFRGEALSSILSVSKVQIVTKTAHEKAGTKLVYEAGNLISRDAVGTVNGTTIIVSDLFFNVPARKKFLKSDRSETIQISDIINKFSIGYPNVKFEYINNNKEMFSSIGNGDVTNCIRAVHGKDVSQNLIQVEMDIRDMSIWGYISNTSVYRNNKSLQYVYINGRTVRNHALSNSIKEAYKSLIPVNKHSICFLNIKIDPNDVDVNIHPAKLEVKFKDEHIIYREFKSALEDVLLKSNIIPKYRYSSSSPHDKLEKEYGGAALSSSEKAIVDDISKENLQISISNSPFAGANEKKTYLKDNIASDAGSIKESENQLSLIPKNAIASTSKDLKPDEPKTENMPSPFEKTMGRPGPEEPKEKNIDRGQGHSVIRESETAFEATAKNTLDSQAEHMDSGNEIKSTASNSIKAEDISKGTPPTRCNESGACELGNNLNSNLSAAGSEDKEQSRYYSRENNKNNDIGEFQIVGTLFNTYIIAQFEKSMFMIDQHAAHERIMFEKYVNAFESQSISSQLLMDPVVINLSMTDMGVVEGNLDFFEKFGFGIEQYGMNSIIIRSVPNMFGQPESEKFIYEIIDELESKDSSYEFKLEKLASKACKSAVKAHDVLYDMEIKKLLNDLSLCVNPFTCPHGRPVIVELTEKEIEKMFKRII